MCKEQIENTLSSSLTVDDLMNELRTLSENGYGDTPVVFARQSNDYWRTVVCDSINDVSMKPVSMEWSSYHNTVNVRDIDSDDKFGDTERFVDDEEDDLTKAVVINFFLCE